MLTLNYPANFVSSIKFASSSLFDLVGANDASAQLQAVEARLRDAQSAYNARRYQDAIDAYKTAQSLIYTALQPGHSIAGHLLDDSVMLPIGREIESALANASLKLAEAIQPVVLTPRAPVTVTGVAAPENLTRLASIGFRQDSSVPADVDVGVNAGLEALAQGRTPQAVEVFTDLLAKLDTPSGPKESATAAAVALDLSSAKLVAGDLDEAKSLADFAEGLFKEASDDAGQAQAAHNRAVALQRLGKADEAQASFDQAAGLYASLATTWGVASPEGNGGPLPGAAPASGAAPSRRSGAPALRDVAGAVRPELFETMPVSRAPFGGATPFLPTRPVFTTGVPPLVASGLLNLNPVASTGISPGLLATRPPVAATAVPSSQLTELAYLRDKDASVVSVRWPGAGAGWGGATLPNPAEVERDERSWTLNVPSNGDLVSLVWKNGARPGADELLDGLYKKRIDAKTIGDIVIRPREPGELTAYLTHLYAFVIPQALGDCYQQLGNFQRAEEYYLQAAAYTYINLALEAPALWVRLAQNALLWGDHLYRQEQIDACKEVYGKVVGSDGTAPAGPLYDLAAFAGPAAEAKKILAAIADPASAGVDPGLALPVVTIWQRWQYLLGGLDYYGTSYTPIFTFEYLQQVALGFAQQAIQAEQEYVNFQVHAEAEAATRRDLQGAVSLSDAETAGRREQLRSAQSDAAAMDAAVRLAQLRRADAQADRDRYAKLGYEQIEYQSIAAAHSAHADWHGDEIRRIARDMEAGSWEGDYGKLAAAATLLAGQKSYEYQLGRLGDTVKEMQATEPIAQAQADSARHREAAAQLALAAAQLRTELTQDALAAFENEVFTPELWTRMAQAMQQLSRCFKEWAISSAKLAERAYNFETDNEISVINGEYAGSETGGMLGSEYLLRDVESFTYHFVAHQRSKETNVKDVISLASEYPLAFGEFLESGKMSFETTLRDFDVRHPGLYGQRVQAVELEVIGLMPPEGIRGTLRAGGTSRYRTSDGAEKTRVHTLDTMALSEFTVRGDGLVYRQDPRMHGLFEGQGVATTWQLDVPRRSNNLDYRLITDVRIVVYYNARFDADLEQKVLTRAPLPGELVHVRDLQLRYDFPEAWYSFLDTGTMTFDVPPQLMPRNETNFKTEKVSLRLLLADGSVATGVKITLKLPGKEAVTMVTGKRGGITTAPGNKLAAKMGGAFLGPWELTVAPPAASPLLGADGKLDGRLLEQIAIVSQYTFDWPA